MCSVLKVHVISLVVLEENTHKQAFLQTFWLGFDHAVGYPGNGIFRKLFLVRLEYIPDPHTRRVTNSFIASLVEVLF